MLVEFYLQARANMPKLLLPHTSALMIEHPCATFGHYWFNG